MAEHTRPSVLFSAPSPGILLNCHFKASHRYTRAHTLPKLLNG